MPGGASPLLNGCFAVFLHFSRGFLPVQVEQPEARGLHAVVHHCRDPLQQLITQLRVGLALAAQADAVKRGRADLRHRPGVSEVEVGRDEPRPAEYLSFVHGVNDQRPLRGEYTCSATLPWRIT